MSGLEDVERGEGALKDAARGEGQHEVKTPLMVSDGRFIEIGGICTPTWYKFYLQGAVSVPDCATVAEFGRCTMRIPGYRS